MSSSDPEDAIVRVFETSRADKGAPYESDRILAYLTAPPAPKGRRVADSFEGRRRFVRFMEGLQIDLGICFTNEEWERGFGLTELVQAVEAKLERPKQQKRLAEKRVREARAALFDEPIKFGIIAACLFVIPAALGGVAVMLVLGLLWMAVVVAIAWVNTKQYRLAQSLVTRISSRFG